MCGGGSAKEKDLLMLIYACYELCLSYVKVLHDYLILIHAYVGNWYHDFLNFKLCLTCSYDYNCLDN